MTELSKKPLIIIEGPTASGKSELAAELCRRIDGEVVSADSMQVYRYMDIGSAKVTLEEMLGVPHHMIDVVEPSDEMDVSRYQKMARECINGIYERGHIPVLCGGTGFYIQAVARDIDFTETTSDLNYREELRALADEKGNEAVHELLKAVDPAAADEIHPNNLKRVIRALEFYRTSGKKISEHNQQELAKESPYDLVTIFLDDERALLYERIDKRVDFMRACGLEDEVAYLKAMGFKRTDVSMQGIGYKEILDAFDGLMTMDEAFEKIKLESRHYAKRQVTWFKRESDAYHLIRSDYDNDTFKILKEVLNIVSSRLPVTIKEVGAPYENVNR